MGKLWETVVTMTLATKYALAFCWRNSRKETLARLMVAGGGTLILYLSIQAVGLIVNQVQVQMSTVEEVGGHSFVAVMENGLLWPFLFLAGVLLFGTILGRFNWFYRSRWNQILRFANQRELNDHRSTLDVARFRGKDYDDLSKRIQELPTGWQTRIWFADEMFNLFATIISFALFGAALLWYKPIYALLLVLMALPMMIAEFRVNSMWWSLFQRMVPHHKKRSMLEKAYHRTEAFVQALMFNQMAPLRKEIDINVGEVLDGYNSVRQSSLRWEMPTHLLAVLGLLGVIAHAVWSTIAYVGEIGTLTVIIAAARTFQSNLEMMVSSVAEQWNSAKGVILIEKDFFGLRPFLKTDYPVIPDFNRVPTITFDRVSFSYPETDMPVLKDVSFSLEAGSKVAIVGKSGHGKSTILALLMRHYDPTGGAIYAEEVNLRNIEPPVWSKVVSALTQEYLVLERKIGAEIASSRLSQEADMEAVEAACQFANFSEVVNSDPDGFDSQIGMEFGGRDFSGGEKQRLALARVRYAGTPILVLDEPDAKLDPDSAQQVIDQVFALQGITVVMITHHVSRAERCDKVIVMNRGEVAEEGTHQELMARGGVYTDLYHKDIERLGYVS